MTTRVKCEGEWNSTGCDGEGILCLLFWGIAVDNVYTYNYRRVVCKECADVYYSDPRFYQFEGISEPLRRGR